MEYYYRTPIDKFMKGGGDVALDQSPPPDVGHLSKHEVFDHFCKDIKTKYNEGHVVLFVTLTLYQTIKHNNRLLWDSSPAKQAEAFRAKINSALSLYEKKYRTGSKSYWFFEAHASGKLHVHGIFAQNTEEQYYPIHIAQLTPCFLKQGFKRFGTKIEYIKHFNEVCAYISKDYVKHTITPLYVLR